MLHFAAWNHPQKQEEAAPTQIIQTWDLYDPLWPQQQL